MRQLVAVLILLIDGKRAAEDTSGFVQDYVFLKLAASDKTYTTRYQDPADPKHFAGFKK